MILLLCVRLEVPDRQAICDIMSKPGSSAESLFSTVSFFVYVGQLLSALYVIVRPLSTVGYTSVVVSVIHSRQWSN